MVATIRGDRPAGPRRPGARRDHRRRPLLPHPPLLLRELGGAARPGGRPARGRPRRGAVRDGRRGRAWSSSAATTSAATWDPALPVDVRRFGTTDVPPARPALPLSLGVGHAAARGRGLVGPVELHALAVARGRAPDVEALADEVGGRPDGTVLLVLGDGSARRGEKAPGLPRRAGLRVRRRARGRAGRRRRRGPARPRRRPGRGADGAGRRSASGCSGRSRRHGGSTPVAALTYRDDPFGVSYFVATWTF